MFGIGFSEIALILLIALLVLGPSKLPDIAKMLGKAIGEFKRATRDIEDTMNQSIKISTEEQHSKLKKDLTLTQPKPNPPKKDQSTNEPNT